MATLNPNPSTAPDTLPLNVEGELYELRNIIGLAAFATEARRVLHELHFLCENLPALDAMLSPLIEHRGQWIESPNTISEVLNDAHRRIGVLLKDEG